MTDDVEKNRYQSGQQSGQQQPGQSGQQGQPQPGQSGQQTPTQDPTKKNPSQGSQDADDELDNQQGQRRAS